MPKVGYFYFRSWKSHYRWQFCRFQQLPKQDLGLGFDETHERRKDDKDLISEGHLGVSESSYGNEWHFIFCAPLCNWVQVSTNCRSCHWWHGQGSRLLWYDSCSKEGILELRTTVFAAAVEEQPRPAMRIALDQSTPGQSWILVSQSSPSVTWFTVLPFIPALVSELRWYLITSRKTTKQITC